MRKSRIQEMSMEVTVGAFMFMILLALAFFTIVLSTDKIFSESYRFEAVFSEVMGLREGENVFVRGVEVGKVKKLDLQKDGVHVIAILDKDIQFKTDGYVEILDSSVLGGKMVQIHEGSTKADLLPPDSIILGRDPINLMNKTSETIDLLRTALDEGGILENLKDTMSQFKKITGKLSRGEGTLGKLLSEDDIYEEFKEITSSFKSLSQRIESSEGTLMKLVDEDGLYNDLTEVVDNLKTFSERMLNEKSMLGQLLSEDNTIFVNLEEASESIKQLAGSLNNSEGTLGKLANDDEIYEEIKSLLGEVRAAIDDIRESSPITTFSSVFFGAF